MGKRDEIWSWYYPEYVISGPKKKTKKKPKKKECRCAVNMTFSAVAINHEGTS